MVKKNEKKGWDDVKYSWNRRYEEDWKEKSKKDVFRIWRLWRMERVKIKGKRRRIKEDKDEEEGYGWNEKKIDRKENDRRESGNESGDWKERNERNEEWKWRNDRGKGGRRFRC